LLSKLIDDDAGSNADIHRVFCAKLRNLQTAVGGVDHLLVNTFYLVTEYDRIATACFGLKSLQLGGVLHLFDAVDGVTLLL
jgi:hypothetical protein